MVNNNIKIYGQDGGFLIKMIREKKQIDKKKQGTISRRKGNAFEKKTREDLEKKGWIVDKWTNKVVRTDETTYLRPVKPMYIKGRMVMNSGGFPDFIAFRPTKKGHEVIGVESKMDGKLDKEEKIMCRWLLENNIFSQILISSKFMRSGRIGAIYEDFVEKYGLTEKET